MAETVGNMTRGKVVAVVLGAGQGTRMGAAVNKIFLELRQRPVILYALEIFERCPGIDEILLVSAAGEEQLLADLARQDGCLKVREVICGGPTRHASEECALAVLRHEIEAGLIEQVLIHDGARPFITVEKVEALIDRTREVGAAILAAPLTSREKIVQVDERRQIQRNFVGEQIWKAQTPQAFQASILLRAYDQAARDGFVGTDTASSVERIGGRVAIIPSDGYNLKLTTPHDLLVAEKLLEARQLKWPQPGAARSKM